MPSIQLSSQSPAVKICACFVFVGAFLLGSLTISHHTLLIALLLCTVAAIVQKLPLTWQGNGVITTSKFVPEEPPTPLSSVTFAVNGLQRTLGASTASVTLLSDYLREHEQLTGTKLSCREGGCGACTVLIQHLFLGARPHP